MVTVSEPDRIPDLDATPVVPALSPARRTATLAAMCLAVGMIVAGVASLNNTLPAIAEDLRVSQTGQQWIVDAYAVTLAALLLPLGAVGDRYGRRLTLLFGISTFSVASALAAFASSGGVLIAARAAMGIGAAAAMPGTLSTITSVFPPESRAKAVGLWAGFAGAGGTLGMILSGVLLQSFWWGSVFLVNVALGVLTVAMILAAVPSTRSTEPVGLDPVGSALSFVGFGLLVLGIIEGPERGWTDPVTLVGLLGGVLAIGAFVRVELSSSAPLLDPRLLRLRGFATGSASLFVQFLAMFGFFFIAVQYLQLVLDYSALKAAVALLPMSVLFVVMSSVAAVLTERYGQRAVGVTGLALSAAGMFLFASLQVDSGFLPVLAYQLVFGVGGAFAMTPATAAIVSSLPAAKQGVASAVNDTARELGAAFGIAILGSAFNIGYRDDIEPQLSRLPGDVAAGAHESPAVAMDVGRGLGRQGAALIDAARESFVAGQRLALAVGGVVALVGVLYIWWRAPGRPGAGADEVVDDTFEESVAGVGAVEPAFAE